MDITKLLSSLKFKSVAKALVVHKEHIGRVDLGVLKVALMVAALDGEVADDEIAAFEAMAKKCRGYSEEEATRALKEAMRSAGYLMLYSRRATDAELVREFISEAEKALPEGFAYYSIEDIRRAVITWIAMGMSDGDYSKREKKCIEALRRNFAEIKVRRMADEEARWAAISPAYRQSIGNMDKGMQSLISQDFVNRVERVVATYGDSAAAQKELKSLMAS